MDLNNYFNLGKESLDKITIKKSHDNASCYIEWNEKFRENRFISGFIISDKDRVVTICGVSFYPSKSSGKFVPRLTFSKVLKRTLEVRETGKNKIRISFSGSDEGIEEFWLMIEFLSRFKNIVDLGKFNSKYEVTSVDHIIKLVNGLDELEKGQTAQRIIVETLDDPHTLEKLLIDNRKKIVSEFEGLLNDSNKLNLYFKRYKDEIKGNGEESMWKHFFKSNQWLLGLTSGLIFIDELIEEQEIGISSTRGTLNPVTDYLGINDYTLLVELKKPTTPIFTNRKQNTARANTWSFSSDFIDGISQCLAQKTDWEKSHAQKNIVNDKGNIVDQRKHRTIDPNVIFILGRKDRQFCLEDTTTDVIIKRDTFERFRRNNRNIEIITYDELLLRAKKILNI